MPACLAAVLLLLSSTAGAGVSGRVLGPDDQPVAGASVRAYAAEPEDERALRLVAGKERTPLASTLTAGDGAFRLALAQPVASVEVRAPGFAPAYAEALDGRPVSLTLARAALRRGTITANGRPVSGAVVVWTPRGGVSGEWMTHTTAAGAYETPDPRLWARGLLVLHPDFTVLEDSVEGNGPADMDHELAGGVAIEGRVVDERGRPVANAVVSAGAWTLWPLGRTTAEGAFRIAHAPRGWTGLRARSGHLAGAATRRKGRATIVVRPARSLAGSVRDSSGRPLAGATVTVILDGQARSAVADARGQYALDGLVPGRYHVQVARTGYSAQAEPNPWPQVDLLAGPARRDFMLVPLPTVRGRVLDEEGRPVADALVVLGFKGAQLYAPEPFSGLGEAQQGSRTSADGSFSLAVPRAHDIEDVFGKQVLIVLKRGYAAARAEIRMAGPTSTPLAVTLGRGIELKGRVSSAEGAPLAGVDVWLAEEGAFAGTMIPMHMLLANVEGEGWTTTGPDGTFRTRVHPAVHDLAFRKAGFAPRLARAYDPRAGGVLEVAMEPAAVVRGRVSHADGRGVPEVQISLSRPLSFEPTVTTTGADGGFEVKDLAPGVYELKAAHPDLGIAVERTVEAPALDVQVLLEPSGTLRGRVVDAASRRPVPAFELRLAWSREPPASSGGRHLEVEDAGGAFVAADVPSGALVVSASAEGYVARGIEDLTVEEGGTAEIEIALEAEAPLRGRVTSEEGAPVGDVAVRVAGKDQAGAGGASTDAQGEYELRGVAKGEARLTFQAPGFLVEKRTVDTRQTARADVTLRRGLALSGEVVSDGAGVSGARVSASSRAANATHQRVETDARGRFRLEGLVPGRYTVSASADEGNATMEDVDPESAGPLRLVLERAPTAVLTGRVVGLAARAEEPMIAMVAARNEETGASGQAFVDESGKFRMESAPAGRITVVGQASTMRGTSRNSRAVEMTLAPGTEAETVLEFPTDVVSGLVSRDGAPVPGVMVSFTSSAATDTSAMTDLRGRYEAVGLEPGRYTVNVSGADAEFSTEHVVTGSGEFDIDITGGAVQGRVVHAEGGAPLKGVEVSLWPIGADENRPATSATTSDQGVFRVRSLREGRYRLVTSKAGFGQEVREVEAARGAPAEVLLELSPADGVTVAVVDARDGHPLAATVVVRDSARRIVANSHSGAADDGSLNIPLAPGSYLLSTSAGGYGTATMPVTSPSRGLRVGLTPGGTLLIESPRPLRGRARLIQPDGEEYVQCWCNGLAQIELQGRRTTVENVATGTYTLEITEEGAATLTRPLAIREGQKTTVSLE